MRHIAALLMLILWAFPLAAQEPRLRIDMAETEAIPGQPVSLRLTILVPSFLPEPPVWPSFEAPDLVVRVVFTGPVSERIDGATWSGVSRRYLLYPMRPGPVRLPSQQIAVTWTDPGTNAAARAALAIGPVTVTGVVPAGAEGLEPFLAARGLTLAQTIEGEAQGMRPGDSLARTVTATIEGTLPMFLPQLLADHRIDGLRAYPDAPVFEDRSSRDVAGGTRTERVTLVAEGGGAGEAGAVRLDWYNLTTGAIETAELAAVPVSVDGPPARHPGTATEAWRKAIRAGLGAIAALGLFLLARRRLLPRVLAWLARRHAAWMASEVRAWRILRRTLAARDHAALYAALDAWVLRIPGPDPRRDPDLSEAIARLGVAKYARQGEVNPAGWRELERTLAARRRRVREKSGPPVLPPLNPGT